MKTYQSRERVQAVKIETVEGNVVNGDITLSESFVSQNVLLVGSYLISNGAHPTDVIGGARFNSLYEGEESDDEPEGEESDDEPDKVLTPGGDANPEV